MHVSAGSNLTGANVLVRMYHTHTPTVKATGLAVQHSLGPFRPVFTLPALALDPSPLLPTMFDSSVCVNASRIIEFWKNADRDDVMGNLYFR